MRLQYNAEKIAASNPKKAAVLALFYPNEHNETCFLLTQRASYKGTHSAQISFPGGKIEEGESSEDAARREVYEEVNFSIPANKKLPLFIMHPYTYSDRNIQLFVQAVQMGNDNIWMQGYLEILINGEKPYSESDIIDVHTFMESMKSDGDFFIFSCNFLFLSRVNIFI